VKVTIRGALPLAAAGSNIKQHYLSTIVHNAQQITKPTGAGNKSLELEVNFILI